MNIETLLSKINRQVLYFLCQFPYDSFYSAQIAKKTSLSKGGVSQSLRFLTKEKLIIVQRKGRMAFYQINISSPIIQSFKLFYNLLMLRPFIEAIKPYSSKIVLFGSCADGTDSNQSDIDMLVISNKKSEVSTCLSSFKTVRKIQVILKSPEEYISLEKKEPVFYNEIQKGRVLWDKI
ncbi:MAG: nucleotidyltransferase domain-containing protein [Candidatus Omnitrophica bacterium]|nr:nucleotidyltransferase domain-containing protein [Candidatus Omnitrophota bacterium]